MGGRFLTVLHLIYPTPKRINKLAPTDGPMPTRGRALPFVARSQGLFPALRCDLRECTVSRFGTVDDSKVNFV